MAHVSSSGEFRPVKVDKNIYQTTYGTFQVQVRAPEAKFNKTFKTLAEAIRARDEFLIEHDLFIPAVPDGFKFCTGCQEVKPTDQFTPGRQRCRACIAGYQAERRQDPAVREHENNLRRTTHKRDPGLQKNRQLKHWYGIDLREYEEMFAAQGGVCAICGKPETAIIKGKVAALAVDHKHEHDCVHAGVGQKACPECIRGLLCRNCNVGLGKVNDSIEWFESAIAYLEKWAVKTDAS